MRTHLKPYFLCLVVSTVPLASCQTSSAPDAPAIRVREFTFKERPVLEADGSPKVYASGELKGKPVIAHAKQNPRQGYHLGMAESYRLMLARFSARRPDAYVAEITAPLEGRPSTDALVRYRRQFEGLGLDVVRSPLDRLRAMYVLLFELGVRESDGRYYCGVDLGPNKPGAEKAALASKDPKKAVSIANATEAGLFQSSWNMSSKNKLAASLAQSFNSKRRTDGMLDTFKIGFNQPDWIKHGDLGAGAGRDFQRLAKDHPNFAVEFAALTVRNPGTRWYFFTLYDVMDFNPEVLAWLKSLEPTH